MDNSVFQQPTPGQLAAFVEGDPLAIDEVVDLVLPQLYRWAISRHPTLPRGEVQSVLNQVFAEICRHHARYDPDKVKFTTYAINLLRKRLADLYETWGKIKKLEGSGQEEHEKSTQAAYNKVDAIKLETRISRDQFYRAAMQRLDEPETEFLKLMLQGEKDNDVFALVLARYGPVKDPAKEVKNMKERLIRKLRTIAQEQGFEGDALLEE